MERSHILLAVAGVCILDAGLAQAQMSVPPVQGDGATVTSNGSTVSILGTVASAITFGGGTTIKGNSSLSISGGLNYNLTRVNSGSTAQTLGVYGGILELIAPATVSSVTINCGTASGRQCCVENVEASTTVTLNSGATNMYLHSSTGTTATTLAAGSGVCIYGDGTNLLEIP